MFHFKHCSHFFILFILKAVFFLVFNLSFILFRKSDTAKRQVVEPAKKLSDDFSVSLNTADAVCGGVVPCNIKFERFLVKLAAPVVGVCQTNVSALAAAAALLDISSFQTHIFLLHRFTPAKTSTLTAMQTTMDCRSK